MTRIKAYCRENAEVKVTLFTEDAHKMLLENGFPVSQFTSGCNMPKVQKVAKARNGSNTRATKVKGVFNVYEMGNTDHQKWEPVQLDSNDPNCDIPKYYIIKRNDGWNFDFSIKGITTSTINTKSKLFSLMRFMDISKDQVVMVSERYAKYLSESQEFSKYVNDNLQLKWNKDAMTTCYENSIHTIERLIENTDFKSIPDTNEFKQYIVTLYNILEKYNKYRDISFLFPSERSGKALEYKGKCKVTQMLVSKIGRWSDSEICLIVNSLK
jgi:hypothetical protein